MIIEMLACDFCKAKAKFRDASASTRARDPEGTWTVLTVLVVDGNRQFEPILHVCRAHPKLTLKEIQDKAFSITFPTTKP